jgi:hypothetical protein
MGAFERLTVWTESEDSATSPAPPASGTEADACGSHVDAPLKWTRAFPTALGYALVGTSTQLGSLAADCAGDGTDATGIPVTIYEGSDVPASEPSSFLILLNLPAGVFLTRPSFANR